jgi:hypothetical protein
MIKTRTSSLANTVSQVASYLRPYDHGHLILADFHEQLLTVLQRRSSFSSFYVFHASHDAFVSSGLLKGFPGKPPLPSK